MAQVRRGGGGGGEGAESIAVAQVRRSTLLQWPRSDGRHYCSGPGQKGWGVRVLQWPRSEGG